MPEKGTPLEPSQELALRLDYDGRRSSLAALAGSVERACDSTLSLNKVPFHSVKSRVKSMRSLLEKIVRKGYEPSLQELDDLVGVRIICLYPKHIDPVVELLKTEFNVLDLVDKRPSTDSSQFGYSSVHLICNVEGTPRSELPEYAGMETQHFEIQVRTIVQEAWAEIEHQLIYKSAVAAPEEIKRPLVRVGAMLELADKEFQEVYDKRQLYIQRLMQTDMSRLREEPLNPDSLLEVLRRKFGWADGWEEVAGGETARHLSELLSEINELGLTTVQQILPLIDKWQDDAYRESERAYMLATGELPAATPEDRTYSFDALTRLDWHRKTKQYFFPIGHMRLILKREFPNYGQLASRQKLVRRIVRKKDRG
jgi:ppGpp synthetase/RelA/SpoT-type nucleotidyltranferase